MQIKISRKNLHVNLKSLEFFLYYICQNKTSNIMTKKEFEQYRLGKKVLPEFDSISLNKPMKVCNIFRKKNIDGAYSWKESIVEYGYSFYLNGDKEKSKIEFTEDGLKFTNYHYDEINNASGKVVKVLVYTNVFKVKYNNIGHFFKEDVVVGMCGKTTKPNIVK